MSNPRPQYALHSLGWNAFQHLCGTILREVWGQTFQVFADTKDVGRDGAFRGIWESNQGELLKGETVVQCKFTSRREKSLSVNDLADELKKVRRLAASGVARNYVLITNAGYTAQIDAELRRKFEAIPDLENFFGYGREWICDTISTNQRLRMLVPRLYGLGDLSQILDERAYSQAREILRSMDDELGRFVVTKAHSDSVRALNDHRFVLLLGEPACGKSTIASALALGAADQWGSHLVKIESPEQFRAHWNTQEPRQFFWVDDAFGQTQYEQPRALAWNYAFPGLQAAIKQGAAVVFTSRDYVYRAALDDLKEDAFPLLREARVVIEVQKLSRTEREQILYNHLKLGRQPSSFRIAIKPFLADVAASKHFLPEIARRLGNPFFTKDLELTHDPVLRFAEAPEHFLRDVTRRLDDSSRAALGMIFMRGGKLPSLRKLDSDEEHSLSLLNANVGSVRKALKALGGTLVVQTYDAGKYNWQFKHPTIRDAFGSIVSEEPDLMIVYLKGTRIDALLKEITCGRMKIKGVKLVIPEEQWPLVIRRVAELDYYEYDEAKALNDFLASRCHRDFLKLFLKENPDFVSSLEYGSWMRYHSGVRLAARLHSCRLLSETERERFVRTAKRLAIRTPDADFLDVPNIRALFRPAEIRSILADVYRELAPKLGRLVKEMREECVESDEDPEDFFWPFQHTLDIYRRHSWRNQRALERFGKAYVRVDRAIETLKKRRAKMESDLAADPQVSVRDEPKSRSIFDDVDE